MSSSFSHAAAGEFDWPPIQICLLNRRPRFYFSVAGHIVESDTWLDGLSAFAIDSNSRSTSQDAQRAVVTPVDVVKPCTPHRVDSASVNSVREASGWLGGSDRGIRFNSDGRLLRLDIDGAGTFDICVEQGITRPVAQPIRIVDKALLEEIVLGPCLALALARRGVFLLHASAIRKPNGSVCLIAANSGTGKSTIARELTSDGSESSSDFARVADDIVALELDGSRLICHSNFPQLKLEQAAMQSIAGLDNVLDVHELLLPDMDMRGTRLRVPIGRAATMRALTEHGVGLRLYDEQLLAAHFQFACDAAEHLKSHRVFWAHRPGTLWALRESA